MADKTQRQVLRASLVRLTVTSVEAQAEVDSVAIGRALLDAAELTEWERVDALSHTSGARLSLPVVVAEGTGDLVFRGAACHFVQAGDVVTLSAWGLLKAKAAARHAPLLVRVEGRNAVVAPAPSAAPKATKGTVKPPKSGAEAARKKSGGAPTTQDEAESTVEAQQAAAVREAPAPIWPDDVTDESAVSPRKAAGKASKQGRAGKKKKRAA